MTFKIDASIDQNHHKGLVLLNSITGSALVATGKSLTNSQPMHVAIVDGSGTQITSFGGGTQYAEATTTTPGTGTLALGRYNATPPSITDGQMYGLQLDSAGNLKITGSLSVGGTTDNSAYTAGTSTGTPAMGFYHSTIDTVTDGRAATVAITPKRAMMVNLQTAAGVEITNTSNALDINIKSGSIANTMFASTQSGTWNIATVTAVTSITNSLPAGSNVIGHVITDTGSTTAVTGTVTISGAVTEASLDAALISQEATTSGIKGLTAFGAVTTNAPSYTTAKSDALSLDTAGLLRISLKDTPANTNKLLVTPDSVALPANQSVNVSQINAVTPLMGNGNTGTGSQRVTIASDNTAFSVNATLSAETTKVIGVTRTSDGAGNLLTSNSTTYTAKFGLDANILGTLGTAFSTAGKVDVKGADGDVFVRQATGSNLHAVLDAGTAAFGKLSANSGVIIGDVNVVSDIPGVGATNTGKAEDAAHTTGDTGVMALGVRNDTLASTTNASADYTQLSTDTAGIVMTAGAPRLLKGRQVTTITSSTAETTILTAVTSTFLDVYGLILTNTSATVTKVSVRDATAGGTISVFEVPATDTRGFMLPVDSAVPQAAVNNNWTAQAGTSVASLEVTVLYVKRV